MFTLHQATAGGTTWEINGASDKTVSLTKSTWYTFKLSKSGSLLYLTVTDASNNEVFAQQTISVNSTVGGLGNMIFQTKRYYVGMGIDNVELRALANGDVPSGTPTSYTVKFQDSAGNSLKDDVTHDCLVDDVVTASAAEMESFKNEGGDTKYIYESGNTELSASETASENIITLVFREAATYTYKLNAIYNDNIIEEAASGSVFEGENGYATIKRHYNVDGTLVVRADADGKQIVDKNVKDYNTAISPTSNDFVQNQNYIKAGKENIVFLAEAEDIEGLTPITSGYLPERFSGGKGAYADGEDKVITTLKKGFYKLTAQIMGTQSACTFTFKAGNEVIWENATNGQSFYVGDGITSEAFELTKETNIVLVAGGGDGSSSKVTNAVDFIYIQYLGDKHTYTLNAVDADGKVIKKLVEGVGYSLDADKYVGIPEYIEVDGTLYQTDANTTAKDYYRRKISLKDGDLTVNVIYKETDIIDVVDLYEAEDLTNEGVTASSAANAHIRCSNAQGAYFSKDINLGVYNPGNYRIWGQVWGNEGTTFTITAGSDEVWSATTTGYLTGATGDIFTLNTHTNLYIKQSGDGSHVLDCFYIQNMGDKVTYELRAYSEDKAIDKTLAEGYGFKNGSQVFASYPRYINVDGTLYEAEKINDQYRWEFPRTATIVDTIWYKKTNITNVAYFSEGEDIEGASATTAGSMPASSSNGACGYMTSDELTITRLPQGNYKATMVCYSNNKAGATQKFNFGQEEDFSATIEGASNRTTITTDVFSLPSNKPMKWIKSDGNAENGVDYIYIRELGDLRTYKVTATSEDGALDSLLAEGSGYANDAAIYVPYPRYINVDGTLYQAKTTGQEYRVKVTLEEDRDIKVTYTKTDKDRVVYYSEAEQIEGMTAVTSGNCDIRCSNAAAAFAGAEEGIAVTTLEAGNYKITGAIRGNAGTVLAMTADNDSVWVATTNGSLSEVDSVVTFTKPVDLKIAKGGNGGSSPKVFDYIYIQSVPETYTYAVKATLEDLNLDTVLVKGEDIEGTLIEAAYPRFMNIDSVLYESQPTDEGKYMTSFTLNDNMVVPIDYAKTRIDKVVFLKEALKLDGKQEAELTDLTPGYYKLTATVTGTDGAVVVVADNDTVWTATNDGTIQNEEAEFELTADTKLNIANGGEAEATVDYLYIQVAEKPVEPEPEPETDHVNFVELDHVKSTAENPEAGIVSDPIALSQGSHVAAADDESGLSLWDAEDGAELRAAVGKSFFITPPEGKALHEVILKGRKLNLKASNGILSETEPEVVEEPEVNQNPENGNEEEVAAARKKVEEAPLVVEEPLVEGEPEAEEPAADEEQTLYWTGNIDKVKFTAEAETAITSIIVISEEPDESTETYTEPVEPEPEPIDTLLAEAKTLLGDSTGVAAGKLIAAIDAYEQVEEKQDADKEALAAAMAQYEKDNEAQENDQTAKVKTDGWKKYDGSNAGVCATQYAPAIDTYDGRKDVKLAEVYESTVATTGTIIYQDITGLQNGTYKVGFYGNAFFTSGRGFDSDMADGAEDVAYVFANDQKEFIVSKIATETTENNFRTFDVEVTDGAIKLGMGKEKPGTNWHTMQIYQLTWMASAKEVYANDLAALKAAIEEAKAEQANELKTEGKEALADAIEAAEAAAESNMLNISELEAEVGKLAQAINDFQTANLVTFEGKYYIQHVASGKFMAAGHNWGTRGIVNAEGLDLTLTADDNKKVTIDSRVANNETNHFLGSNLYMDAGAFGWTIEKLSDDSYAIGDGTKYLTIDADDNLTLADEGASWKFVAAETLEAERLAANMATLAAATKDNGVDATFLIKTPQFNRNDQRNADNWTVSEDCTNKNLGGGSNDTQFNGCAESYHSTFTISQLVAGAPKGTYRMTAQGFYRQDGDSAETTPLFFMNDATAEVPAKTGSENSMAEAGASFTAGEYTIEPIEVFVGEGATLTVGIKNETAKNQWIIFDNFRLTYFGEEDSTTPKLPKYTVNEVIDGQVVRTTEGQAELGTTVKVPYRHYNLVDGKLYSKGVTSKEYNYSFKFETDGQEETITGYTATGTQDIVFLSEGEDIEGLTPCTGANTAIRSSNSASAYAADADVEITKLPAGTYKLTAAIFDASKNPNSMWYFIAGTDTIAKLNCTTVNYQERTSEKFTLEAETSIMLAKGGNANMGIDLVYIQAVEAVTPIFSYTVNEVANGQTVRTTEGTAEKASVVKVPFREYNVVDGKLYKKAQINKEFNYSFTLNNDKQTENLEYEATETENVVFLKEGEDIEGLTKITTGNTAIRSSNSASAYAAEGNVEFVTLPAGVYKLTAGIYDANKTPDSHWKFLAGETEIADLNCTTVNIQELTSDEFTLTEETKLYIAQGGASNMGIDFIYIVKTGEATPDGISAIKAAAEKGAVYDMQGRKQSGKLRKGLYIMDGKVISVK